MDKLTPPQRHNNMPAIRGKNTKPEPLQDEQLDKVSRGMRHAKLINDLIKM